MTITAEELIFQYCMGLLNPNPDYYEGHGNNLRDLNSSILELVYKGVHTEFGPAAAKSFVNMVKNLKNTNATSFLHEFYRLEKKGWKYGEPVLKVRVKTDTVIPEATQDAAGPKPPQPGQPEQPVRRVTEILNAFKRSGSLIGHDKAITEDFLKKHKDEVDASQIASSFGGGG